MPLAPSSFVGRRENFRPHSPASRASPPTKHLPVSKPPGRLFQTRNNPEARSQRSTGKSFCLEFTLLWKGLVEALARSSLPGSLQGPPQERWPWGPLLIWCPAGHGDRCCLLELDVSLCSYGQLALKSWKSADAEENPGSSVHGTDLNPSWSYCRRDKYTQLTARKSGT